MPSLERVADALTGLGRAGLLTDGLSHLKELVDETLADERKKQRAAKSCKDCAATGVTTQRPAPHPGPRCASHHRDWTKAARKAAHGARIERTFGITLAEYDAIYLAQGERCAICRWARGVSKKLAVDHDHALGNGRNAVRGLLCGPCNQMLGRAGDDPEFFRRAARYLIDPPAPTVLVAL